MNPHTPFREQRLTCPNCAAPLVEIERAEVMIDACQQCRGVWLDRGELDRLLERERRVLAGNDVVADRDFVEEMSGRKPAPAPEARPAGDRYRDEPPRRDRDDDRYRDRDDRYRGDDRYGKRRKKKSFSLLEELFDFD